MTDLCIVCKKNPVKDGSEVCSSYCKSRLQAKNNYYKNRDNPEYRLAMKNNFKRWYLNNKEKQHAYIKKSYYKNRSIWALRSFNRAHRKVLLGLLPNVCGVCGKEGQNYIAIRDTKNTTKPKIIRCQDEENMKKYIEYCKSLMSVCSRDCLGLYHRETK